MRVVFAGASPQDREDGRRAALRTGLECAAADCVSLSELRLRLSRDPRPHLVVAFLGNEPDAAPLLCSATEHGGLPVFAVAGATGPSPEAAELGVTGVWRPGELRDSLLRAADDLRKSGRVSEAPGRVLAVVSAHPGAGVTTVAAGLAFALPGPGSVALVELTNGVPELALDLDLKPRHSLADLIRAGERADVSMVRAAAVPHPSGVSVLAHAPDATAAEPVTAAAARDFLILLRAAFPWSVIDVGHAAPAATDLLRDADAVVVVTRLDPPGLRLTRRFLTALADAGVPPGAVAVAGNRYGQSGLVPWRKAEEALKLTVRAWLPDDPGAVNRALLSAEPVARAAPRSALARALAALGTELQTRFAAAGR